MLDVMENLSHLLTLIRLLMLLLILFGGLSIWAYIILWIVIPEEPARKFNINSKNR